MSVFVNRVLNLKKIKAIGFDMDYTIVQYNTEEFENMTHQEAIKKLIDLKGYPKEIESLKFEFERVIQGIVINKRNGHLLKLSRFGKVKSAMFGLEQLSFKEQEKTYRNLNIDLNDEHIQSLDTSFSISNGVLFTQLVELKKQGLKLPDYLNLADDVNWAIDLAHADGTLKSKVGEDIERFIIKDPEIPPTLERLKKNGKKLMVITNSDYNYCKLLLDYTFTPFLKEHDCWKDLFDVVITLSSKPRFFNARNAYLKIENDHGMLSNYTGDVSKGIFQGGYATRLQEHLGLEGDEILYLGDHIYGDVVTIKKNCNWRTALVLDPLKDEVEGLKESAPSQEKIDQLMEEKKDLELVLNGLDRKDGGKEESKKVFAKIESINKKISEQLDIYQKHFNPYWGELMRAGQEESRFADQVLKYACIYMAKVSDLKDHSPKTYFRPEKRTLPHERL